MAGVMAHQMGCAQWHPTINCMSYLSEWLARNKITINLSASDQRTQKQKPRGQENEALMKISMAKGSSIFEHAKSILVWLIQWQTINPQTWTGSSHPHFLCKWFNQNGMNLLTHLHNYSHVVSHRPHIRGDPSQIV